MTTPDPTTEWNTHECPNGHKMTGIGFDDLCPECELPWLPKTWLDTFNAQFIKDGKLYGNHLILKDFIRNLLQAQREQIARDIEALRETTMPSHAEENGYGCAVDDAATIARAPKHEQPYNQHDHYHCWQSDNPPCGIQGTHRCCLCTLPPKHDTP